MEKKISDTNEKLKSQDKPGFHRATGKQHALTQKEKAISGQKTKSAKQGKDKK
ncbi:MAG: hypothetical protein ABIN36_17025 [Ferruginibacter sp.]